MKTISTLLLAMFAIVNISLAQIPNSGFENWTNMGSYNNPDNWSTLNNTTAPLSVYTATKGTPGSPGSAYLKLTSKTAGSTVANGIAVCGTLDSTTMTPIGGFPFSSRPAAFTGKWQHMIYGTSQGSISVVLTRWDAGMNIQMPVASGSVTLSGMAMSWANFNIPLTYTDSSNPDSCLIIMRASGNTPANNDYLWVDNLAFTGTVTGLNENHNPSENLLVSCTNHILKIVGQLNELKPANVYVTNLSGQVLFEGSSKPNADGKVSLDIPLDNSIAGMVLVTIEAGMKQTRCVMIQN